MLREVRIVVTHAVDSDWKGVGASSLRSADHADVPLVTFMELCVACLWPPTGMLFSMYIVF